MSNPFDPGYYQSEELRSFGFKSVGENVQIARNCTIIGLHNIEIGDNSRIDGFCTIIASSGPLVLGRYVHIHTNVVIGCRGGVEFRDFSGASHGCHIFSASDDFSGRFMTNSTVPAATTWPKVARVVIGRHVPLGTNCTILPGVTIGDGAAVCAHSLVTRNVADWTIVSGAPARNRLSRSRRLLALEESIAERSAAA